MHIVFTKSTHNPAGRQQIRVTMAEMQLASNQITKSMRFIKVIFSQNQ